MAGLGLLSLVFLWAVILYALYWVVRLGVRHGVRDANRSD